MFVTVHLFLILVYNFVNWNGRNMFRFNNISKEYKGHFWEKRFVALDNVSLSVGEGEVVGFLGANGAGKTTSIKIIMNFISPTSGEIEFDKKLGKNSVERFSNIGFFPERPYFYPHLTGREFISYLGQINKVERSIIEKRLMFWADKLRLTFALDRKIRSYSKGMLQRLGFISANIHDPKLIILDEPLSGLDPIGRKEFKDTLKYLSEKGKTIFFSSHIVADIEEVCKKVIVLESGKLMYQGSISELIEKDSHTYVTIRVKTRVQPDKDLYLKSQIIDRSQDVYEYEVEKKLQDKFLNEILKHSGDILFLGVINPTLEEIIYKIKN